MLRSTALLALLFTMSACGNGSGTTSAPTDGSSATPAASTAGTGEAPDTSGLADIVLGKINADPTRQDMKATAKLLDFNIVSVNKETHGDSASAVVECAGTVEFDADAEWGMSGVKKAGEPAKFECRAEYASQGGGVWEIFGPMGIYPL